VLPVKLHVTQEFSWLKQTRENQPRGGGGRGCSQTDFGVFPCPRGRAAERRGPGSGLPGLPHRLVRSRAVPGRTGVTFLARWPSPKAMQHARDRIRFMTMRARLAAPVEQVVQEINLFLRGWAGYFRYGNSAHAFDQIRRYAVMRLAVFIAKRHQRGRAWGFAQIYCSGDDLGSDQPQRNRRRTQAPPGLAGDINTAGEGRR